SGSNVPEAIELLNASGNVTQTLVLSTNQVGSVQLVTNATTGEVVQRIEYDEFGRALSDSAPGMQPFGFAGGLYDAETKLVRFGARDYSSEVGRWIARDPVRTSGHQLNFYVYVQNDPQSKIDENGLLFDASSFLEVTGGFTATLGLACLAAAGVSNPVGWGLIIGGIVISGSGVFLNAQSQVNNMTQAEKLLKPATDKRKREKEEWEQYEQVTK